MKRIKLQLFNQFYSISRKRATTSNSSCHRLSNHNIWENQPNSQQFGRTASSRLLFHSGLTREKCINKQTRSVGTSPSSHSTKRHRKIKRLLAGKSLKGWKYNLQVYCKWNVLFVKRPNYISPLLEANYIYSVKWRLFCCLPSPWGCQSFAPVLVHVYFVFLVFFRLPTYSHVSRKTKNNIPSRNAI